MKKIYYIMMVAAIAFAFTSCEEGTLDGSDDTEQGGGGEGTDNPGGETQDPNTLTYGGITYKTVTLSNGQTWMAEPLRYVPDGMTVSNDPADDNAHIWYPYSTDGETTTPLTDDESVAENGYLYDIYAALGIEESELTAENAASYEGAQGICPDGWHIPTWQDFFDLCGNSNRTATVPDSQTNEDALFYDESYNGGSVDSFNQGGWNFVLSGAMMKSSYTANPVYQKTVVKTSEKYNGKPGLTYYTSSTFYQAGNNNLQFHCLGTTFTTSYPEGRVNVMFTHCESGLQIRCVKDAE